MADYTFLDVGYGYFGAPSYDENEQSWAFGRDPGRHHVLQFLGGFETLFKASPSANLTAAYLPHHTGGDQRARKIHAKRVFDSFPEFRGSLRLIEPSLLASQIISRAQRSYDPSQGDLLAVGMLKPRDKNHGPLYALPGGESGESLQLVKTELVAQSFGKRVDHMWVPRPTKDVSWWVGRGAPLRQICFATTYRGEKASKFLAIRTPSSTWVFRLQPRSALVPPAGYAMDTSYPFSPIEIEPLLEIPFPTQCEHADVAFNPGYDRQLAVIDQVGRWLVLDLKSGKTVERYKSLFPTSSGVITRSDDGNKNKHRHHSSKYPEDGWARIRWAGDVNTLILCTRKLIEFVDLKGRPMSAPDLTLGLAARDEKPWHLDVRVCEGQRDQLFILTTTKIFWLRVFSADSAPTANERAGGKILLSVRHFRDPRDLTMQIKVLEDDNENLVALHSRSSPIISCYRFGFSDDYNVMPILMSDPSDLTIPSPENLSVPNISAVIDDIHIQRLGSIKKTGQYQMNSDPHRTHLYELLVLLSDLSLVRSLMYSQCDQSAKTIVPVPKLSKGPIEPLQGLDGSFVVPNGVPDNSLDGADDMTLRREGMDRFVTARLQAREASAPRQTFDMRQVYEQLISDLDVREERVPVGPFSLLEGVRRLLTETDEVIHPATSLLELGKMSLPSFPTEKLLAAFLDMEKSTRRMALENYAFLIERLPSLSLSTGIRKMPYNSSVSVTYKRLVSEISENPLPDTHADFLDMRQKTSIFVAAEICLSSAKVSLPPTDPQLSQTTNDSQVTSQSFPRSLALPLHPLQSHSQSSLSSQPLIQTQANSQPARPALAPGMEIESRRSILTRYARFTRPIPLPRSSTARNLKHWKLSDNPLEYQYTAITRSLDLDFETSQMTVEERQRAAAKRRRLEQRQARESERFIQLSQTAENQVRVSDKLPPGGSQALAMRPSQSLLKTALERDMTGSQIPLSSQASVGASQPPRRKRKKGF